MPELPEVETMRRGILGAVGGTIVTVEKIRCRKKPIEITPAISSIRKRVTGKQVIEIDRIGKRVVMCLGKQSVSDYLVFEPRMTGLVLVASPPTPDHLRFGLTLGNCDVDQVLYWDRRGLGNVRLLNKRELNEQLGPLKVGPDALRITIDELAERFSGSNREIKVESLAVC